MQRIAGDGHVDNMFVEGSPTTGQEATRVTADWLNAVQEEVIALIAAMGVSLDAEDNTQLATVIQSLHKGRILGFTHRQKDADEVTLDGGFLDINGLIYGMAESLDKQFTSLTAVDWIRIYAAKPSSGARYHGLRVERVKRGAHLGPRQARLL